VIAYPAPAGAKACRDYDLSANDHDIFVYETGVHFEPDSRDKKVGYAYFDMTAPIDVRVRCKDVVKAVAVRPVSLGIKATIVNEHELAFHLDKPAKLSMDINGRTDGNLILFAGSPDPNPPSPKDPNVRYFGPGIHTVTDNEWNILTVKSGETIYLAGGAILRARLFGKDVKDVTIRGRGIIDGSTLPARHPPDIAKLLGEKEYSYRPVFVDFQNAENIRIEGVHLIDSPMWTIRFDNSKNVVARDLRLIGYVWNADGIDIVNTINARVEDCFIRTSDDCIVIKGLPNKDQKRLDVKDVVVERCTLWADRASALEIGHETQCAEISNVTFRDIDILDQVHETIGYHAIDIHAGDQAVIHDILYDNIRVENCARLIGMKVEQGQYNQSKDLGRIRDVLFRNIQSALKSDLSLYGHSDTSGISRITFENLTLGGKPMEPEIHGNSFVRDLTFVAGGKTRTIGRIVPADLKFEPLDLTLSANQFIEPILFAGPRLDDLSGVGELPRSLTPDGILFRFIDRKDRNETPQHDEPRDRIIVLPLKAAIPVDRTCTYLFVLHGCIAPTGKLNDVLWTYTLHFADGTKHDVPVRLNTDVCPWNIWAPGGWVVKLNEHKFYIQMIVNPHPSKKIESIAATQPAKNGTPMILAITTAP
jgi:hypothetical protein